jgi:hypothetical protein
METGAQFSDCRKYRYSLWRTWAKDSHVLFVALNPSTADEKEDDPTIRRCIGFAKAWGFGGIYMLNLFAYRTTDPANLALVHDPIGPKNDEFLQMYLDPKGLNVACWGNGGKLMDRARAVVDLLGKENLSCLGITASGEPKHPLYLKKGLEPISLWCAQ